MLEGKLTLPVIYALQSTGDEAMLALAHKVKQQEVNAAEIASLVAFTKAHGGIEYAEQQMAKRHAACMQFIDERVGDAAIKTALTAYLDYVIARKS